MLIFNIVENCCICPLILRKRKRRKTKKKKKKGPFIYTYHKEEKKNSFIHSFIHTYVGSIEEEKSAKINGKY